MPSKTLNDILQEESSAILQARLEASLTAQERPHEAAAVFVRRLRASASRIEAFTQSQAKKK